FRRVLFRSHPVRHARRRPPGQGVDADLRVRPSGRAAPGQPAQRRPIHGDRGADRGRHRAGARGQRRAGGRRRQRHRRVRGEGQLRQPDRPDHGGDAVGGPVRRGGQPAAPGGREAAVPLALAADGRGAGVKVLNRLWFVPLILVVWQLVTTYVFVDDDFPPPTQIVVRMYELWFSGPASRLFLTDDAIGNIAPSLGRMFGGWILAALVGVVCGVILGRSRKLSGYVDGLIEFGRAVPPPMLLPLFVVLFQSGLATQLATIVFGVIWPVLLNSIDGARSVDRTYTETATVFGLSRTQHLRVVVIPAASPKIFA